MRSLERFLDLRGQGTAASFCFIEASIEPIGDPLGNPLGLWLFHQSIAQAQQFLADRFQFLYREAFAQSGNMLAEPGAQATGEIGLALG